MLVFKILLLLFSLYVKSVFSEVTSIRIGAIFDEANDDAESVFRFAVNDINQKRIFHPHGKLRATTLRVAKDDNMAVATGACHMMKMGVFGIFGPFTSTSSNTIQSFCDTMDIPHLEAKWNMQQQRGSPSINLYPEATALSKVILDLVKHYNWEQFTIMYENSNRVPRVGELLKIYDPKGFTVTMRQLNLGVNDDNYRPTLRRVKDSQEKNLILDCTIESLPEILKQAQQVGLLSTAEQLIITNLDLHTLDLESFQYGDTKIMGVRMFDPENEDLKNIMEVWENHEQRRGRNISENLLPSTLRVENALIYDAVHVFAAAIKELDLIEQPVKHLVCDVQPDSWDHGFTMVNFMKASNVLGITRLIKFDHQGFRSDFVLDLVELGPEGLTKFGTWNSTYGIKLVSQGPGMETDIDNMYILRNVHLIVITALSEPYGMLKNTTSNLYGNDRYEGYGVELIDELSKILGFTYTFRIQEDNVYGSIDAKTQEMTGMLKEVIDRRADLAITDLTITEERVKAVDFTMPFMTLGVSILYKAPTKQEPGRYSFMEPFSADVWKYLGGTWISVSLLLYILGRLSPAEWQNPFPCVEEPEVLHNQFSLRNSFWFTMGSFLQQGTELAPAAASTRMIAGMWWFFTLIIVSSYTANLAASLTTTLPFSPIKSAEDLEKQSEIAYGAKNNGSTYGFFKGSEYHVYKRMFHYMRDHPEHMTGSNEAGLDRVKKLDGNYAFLMESTTIEYISERECNVAKVGDNLDEKGYGIAMRKRSKYRHVLSEAVLRLQESGKLQSMRNKWWKEKRGGGACLSAASDGGGAVPLSMTHLEGAFLVMIMGLGAAVGAAFLELICHASVEARRLKISFWVELFEEVKEIVIYSGDARPVRQRDESLKVESNPESANSDASKNTSRKRKSSKSPIDIGFTVNMKQPLK